MTTLTPTERDHEDRIRELEATVGILLLTVEKLTQATEIMAGLV